MELCATTAPRRPATRGPVAAIRAFVAAAWVTAACVAAGCAPSRSGDAGPAFLHELGDGPVPWTREGFAAAPAGGSDGFTFAIVGDLNGGERAGVFEVAIEQLLLLRPDLVMSVGDLIDGASEDPAALNAEWDSFDERARRVGVPLFRVSGNHDATAPALREVWLERYGALHYHFVYRDVLFLVLDTEDYTPERRVAIRDARDRALAVSREDPDRLEETEYYRMQERLTGDIGPAQAAYFRRAIAEHPDVRWTLLFMHKPVWLREDEPDFAAIEEALADRPYSVFAGHYHAFSHEVRKGRDHTRLATTGGGQIPSSDRSFDHVTLVAMTPGGPTIAHLRMDGILDRTGRIPAGGDTLCFQASACGDGS